MIRLSRRPHNTLAGLLRLHPNAGTQTAIPGPRMTFERTTGGARTALREFIFRNYSEILS